MLEYHQKLFVEILDDPDKAFTKLVIQRGLEPEAVLEFYNLCDRMSKKLEEQKEGFIYFRPLLQEFAQKLDKRLEAG